MATTIQQIADEAWVTLGDTNGANGVRWKSAEIIAGVNEGSREVVVLRPDAYPLTQKVTPAADTRQTLAGCGITNGIRVLRVLRNWNLAGSTVGTAITRMNMSQLDNERPAWHSDSDAEAIHYDIDPTDPAAFYLWPKPAGKVEIVFSAVPAARTALSDNIVLGDEYRNALRYYLLFYTLTKRTQGSQTARSDAAGWYTLFQQSLGLSDKSAAQALAAVATKEASA